MWFWAARDNDAAVVLDHLAGGGLSIGQPDSIDTQVDNATLINAIAAYRVFLSEQSQVSLLCRKNCCSICPICLKS
jgi:hypothetical protein